MKGKDRERSVVSSFFTDSSLSEARVLVDADAANSLTISVVGVVSRVKR